MAADSLRLLRFFVVCILSVAACQERQQKLASLIEYRHLDFFEPHTPIPLEI